MDTKMWIIFSEKCPTFCFGTKQSFLFCQNPRSYPRYFPHFCRYYTQYKPELEKEAKIREQNIQKIGKLKSCLEKETVVLNKKLEFYLKKAKQENEKQTKLFLENASQKQ